VRVEIDDGVVFDGPLRPGAPVALRRDLVGRGVDAPTRVRIVSDTFVPRVVLGTDDDRTLGIVVSHLRLGPRSPAPRMGELARLRRVRDLQFNGEFLESYECVVANSQYTAGWVERLWGRAARVLEPPVRPRSRGPKRPIILSVGRFFPNVSGHSKKQVELVNAFRIACERGLHGWELHLVGGCKDTDRAYAEEARKAAVGLPVRFHINAPGEDVAGLFAAADLFWHAGGYGEDLARHPDRFEHFGITVVEAMSAGAVPLVYDQGGPADIVGASHCGRVYGTLEQLATETLALAADPGTRRSLSARAMEEAAQYSAEEFEQRTRKLATEVLAMPSAVRGSEPWAPR
jgi:glycosyltransferase involved in cell wall biosynthesis